MSDVLITPASSKIEFKDASSNIDGTVKLDSDGNLELTSNNGISFGDTSSDVFIGNGTDNVDLKFEADGSITGTSGVTLTLGSSNSNVKLISNELQINATSGVITATTLTVNSTLSANGGINIRNTATVSGQENTDAILELIADEGDDNQDKWRIRSDATGNMLKFETYASGSWSDGTPLSIQSNGGFYLTGSAVIDDVNINDHVIQLNGPVTNDLTIRGKGTGGSQHLKLDDNVTVVGTLTVEDLPTSDPGVAGQLFRSGNDLRVSTG